MALMRKPCCESDIDERSVGSRYFAAGEFYPESADIFPYCTVIIPPKLRGEIYRMHADEICDCRNAQAFGEFFVQYLPGPLEPDRGSMPFDITVFARGFDYDLKHKPFDCQRRQPVHAAELIVESGSEPDERAALKIDGRFEYCRVLAEMAQPLRPDFYIEGPSFGVVKMLRVQFIRRMKGQRRRPAGSRLLSVGFGVNALAHKTYICVFVRVARQMAPCRVARLVQYEPGDVATLDYLSTEVSARQPHIHCVDFLLLVASAFQSLKTCAVNHIEFRLSVRREPQQGSGFNMPVGL